MGKASRRPLQSTLSREPIHVCNGESVALHRPSCGGKSSKLERRFEHLWHALKGPELVREFQFHPTRKWRADFAHLPSRTLIEIEGGIWTQGRHNRAAGMLADLEKYNAAYLSGWRVFRLADVHLTLEVVGRIRNCC